MVSPAVAASGVTTPGQVAATAAGAIAFGVFLWIVSPYFGWPTRALKDYNRGSLTWKLAHWALPSLFVLGGLIAEIVALVGALTGTVWHTGA